MTDINYDKFAEDFLEIVKTCETDPVVGFKTGPDSEGHKLIHKALPESADRIKALGVLINKLGEEEVIESFGDNKEFVGAFKESLSRTKDLLEQLQSLSNPSEAATGEDVAEDASTTEAGEAESTDSEQDTASENAEDTPEEAVEPEAKTEAPS